MNTSNPAGRYPPPAPGTGPTRKRSAGSSQACSRRRASSSGRAHAEVAREHRARAVQNQPAVACEARRPGLVGERSGGRAPGAADGRQARIGRRSAERAAEDRADVLEAAHPGIIPDAPGRRRRGRRGRRPRPADACRSRSRAPGRARRSRPSRLCARPRSSSLATSSSSSTRPHAAHLAHEVGLGREQRQHGRALLALRAVVAQVALALRERELVVMRARSTCCRARCRPRGGPRARPAGPPRPRARAPRSAARPPRRARRSPPDAARTARAAPRPGGRARGGSPLPSWASCASQGGSASWARDAAAQPAQQLVALLQRAGVGAGDASRSAARSARPRGRGSAAAAPGAPFITARRSGVNTSTAACSASASIVAQGAPSTVARFGEPGWKPTAHAVGDAAQRAASARRA